VDRPAVAAPAAEPMVAAEPANEHHGLSAEYGKTQALVTVRLLGPMQITTQAASCAPDCGPAPASCSPTT
jgi:hypothetical protein